MIKKIIEPLKKHYKFIILLFVLAMGFLLTCSIYNGISTGPAKKAFDRAFNFFLAGDCDKYSKSYHVSFSEKFLNNYGDTDWPGDATYQKQEGIANKCRENKGDILDVRVKKITREKFSDTAFIQAEVTTVNKAGVHHIIPRNFVMKKFYNKWLIDTYCDTENDKECK